MLHRARRLADTRPRTLAAAVATAFVSIAIVGCMTTASHHREHEPGSETGVYINGQPVTLEQWIALSNAAGTPVAPGHYWVDGNSGWAGYAGNPTPLVNLYTGQWNRHAVAGGSPADAWLSGTEWSGGISSGTVAPNGDPYSSVYSVDGEVLTLP